MKKQYKQILLPALVIGGAFVAIKWLRKKQVENLEALQQEIEAETETTATPSVEDLVHLDFGKNTTGKKKKDTDMLVLNKKTTTTKTTTTPTATVENGIFKMTK